VGRRRRNNVVGRIVREQTAQRRIQTYTNKGRFISNDIYKELKARRRCDVCGNKTKGPPEIHHKIPVRHGGSNDHENLMALCHGCHMLLDSAEYEQQSWAMWEAWDNAEGDISSYRPPDR